MKTIIIAYAIIMVSSCAYTQDHFGREYIYKLEANKVDFNYDLLSDSAKTYDSIAHKANELRFYKFNEKEYGLVLIEYSICVPMEFKFINFEGNPVYKPTVKKKEYSDKGKLAGTISAIVHDKQENWFLIGIQGNIRESYFIYYEPLKPSK